MNYTKYIHRYYKLSSQGHYKNSNYRSKHILLNIVDIKYNLQYIIYSFLYFNQQHIIFMSSHLFKQVYTLIDILNIHQYKFHKSNNYQLNFDSINTHCLIGFFLLYIFYIKIGLKIQQGVHILNNFLFIVCDILFKVLIDFVKSNHY